MSVQSVCPECGGHKPALMACKDCGFTHSRPATRPFSAAQPRDYASSPSPKPKPKTYKAPNRDYGDKRTAGDLMAQAEAKNSVVIKTKKRRTYTLPEEE